MSLDAQDPPEPRPEARRVAVPAPRGDYEALLTLPLSPDWKSAVVVVCDGPTLDPFLSHFATRLATEGHATLAMGHDAKAGGSFVAAGDRVKAGLEFLKTVAISTPPRFGVVGLGKGGFDALVAGYRCQVGVAVSFYGYGPARLQATLASVISQPKRHAASLLFLFGGDDPEVRPSDVASIRERLATFRMRNSFIIYPRTKGDFCRPDSDDYRAGAAEDAWGRLLFALETAPRLRHRFSSVAAIAQADRRRR